LISGKFYLLTQDDKGERSFNKVTKKYSNSNIEQKMRLPNAQAREMFKLGQKQMKDIFALGKRWDCFQSPGNSQQMQLLRNTSQDHLPNKNSTKFRASKSFLRKPHPQITENSALDFDQLQFTRLDSQSL